ncbi:F0F1 ATP synthase subunit A [uncultured Enterovirga sp.]|uniref:F0F1 ATP synthase subunit A n=1 Tax=uncultured Enterovirga sp. TaxID=2026352 RepID=UPI0035CA6504
MADPTTKIDPIHQFELLPIIPQIGLTQSSLYMLAAAGLISLAVYSASRTAALVPGRLQSLVELSYEFVATTVRQSAGEEGMRFFPLVFSLFTFVLVLNLFGMIPYGFTVTSHIIVTFALAMVVVTTVIAYGFAKHGTHFLQLFVPSGIPGYILPLVAVIEVISFLSRPISLSVRLFANMLAGHIALKIFAAFVASLLSYSAWTVLLAPLPLALAVAFTALEFLVAFLQAYVFALLSCMYLNDALHPGH